MTRTQMDCIHAIRKLGVALHEEGTPSVTRVSLASYNWPFPDVPF